MKYDFDQIIDREGTGSVKYDLRRKYFGKDDILPLWVADMDFACPGFITDAIMERARHPVYGYTFIQDGFYNSICYWMQKRHGWKVDRDWILFSPGILPAIHLAVIAFTNPGEKVIVQPPVYFRFNPAIEQNGRIVACNQLIEKDNGYEMDLDGLERIIDPSTRLLLLCHPHNPTGNVWNKDVLERLVDICHRKSIIILSDEIHSDLILGRHKHIPLASLSAKASEITITCISPSKSFNLAGLSSAAMIIPDHSLKKSMKEMMEKVHLSTGNIFGLTAFQAAYEQGEEWLDQLLDYLEGNLELLTGFLHDRIPKIKIFRPDSTFMAWLDFRDLKLMDHELHDLIIHKAGLGLVNGKNFGPGGEGFQRINFALPRSILLKALERLEKAIYSI